MSGSDRPFTPFEKFDSRPKIPTAKPTRAPTDPFEGLSSLRCPIVPGAPRLPKDAEEMLRRGQDEMATDPAPPMAEIDSERTPLESPYSLKSVSKKLDDIFEAVQHIADETVELRGDVRGFRKELKEISRRLTTLEATQRWAPLVMAALALVVSLWLVNELQSLRAQLRELREGTHVSAPAPQPTPR